MYNNIHSTHLRRKSIGRDYFTRTDRGITTDTNMEMHGRKL
jgi:hypothetical protein